MGWSKADLMAKGYGVDGDKLVDRGSKPSGRYHDLEAGLHAEIEQYCRSRGWVYNHCRMDVPSTAGVGTPDFVVAIDEGVTVWAEAKAKTGKATMEQLAWQAALRKLGHRVGIVRSLEEFIRLTL